MTRMVDKNELGVAFSGGGIRSAAFCSGVLRRLIRKKREPDFLSCVSGGGYTGSAYVQWKYHEGRKSDDWTGRFFDHMRARSGYLCNWQKWSSGCMDSLILGALFVFVAIIDTIAGWGSLGFPIAFVVKLLYGKFLDGSLCRNKAGSNDCLERTYLFSFSLGIFVVFRLLEYGVDHCNRQYLKMKLPKVLLRLGQLISGATFAFTFFPWFIDDFLQHTDLIIRIAIVLFTAVLWFFIPLLRTFSSLGILIYAHSYIVYWHIYKDELFGIKYTQERFRNGLIGSLVLLAIYSVFGNYPRHLVHMYNRWRLQKAFYNQELDCCGCINEEQSCHCYDFFPGAHCPEWCCLSCKCPLVGYPGEAVDSAGPTGQNQYQKANAGNRSLTLADLHDLKPLYISSMVANGWRREHKRKYCLLAMSPKGIYVTDKQPRSTAIKMNDYGDFGENLKPSDIKLSSAMAMSAAAVSPHLGMYRESERQFTHILSVCGIEMAANIVYDMNGERNEHWCGRIWLYVANCIVFFGISIAGVFIVLEMLKPTFPVSSLPIAVTSSIVGGILAVLLVVSLMLCLCPRALKCCKKLKKFSETLGCCSRWCIVHVPIYRLFRSMLNIVTDSETPPAMLHLSDGGHFENFGLLPLLKLRLPKILLVDGSEIKCDDDYAKGIVQAMKLARELFDCSFTPITGNGDVLTDIKNKYVHPDPKSGKLSRKYEFKVHYSGSGGPEGHIVLIAPRPPEEGKACTFEESLTGSQNTHTVITEMPQNMFEDDLEWVDAVENPSGSINIEMSEKQTEDDTSSQAENRDWQDERCEGKRLDGNWGRGPYLTKDDVAEIERCPGGIGCCECCHSNSSCGSFFTFPRHPTFNQFFTPRMFSAYHREGYRACMECDHFLTE